ncbi:MAG: NUDIX hydrolase [Corynebacterium sp.]|uniref:NUDIX hydrolase n=1 Tax=Corynebacterium sp. TaxID=1720 RepID=UPI0026DC5D28|nr:NUDIX hydrolase [Corynebacterium sp.]MDO5098455.1 NUDIX hydrolase [Corynebacterium sp.]
MAVKVEGYGGAKLAVTVVLVRDGATGIEVYVQERVSSMPTFPNATVFPGGGVDPRDFELDVSVPTDAIGADSSPRIPDATWHGPDLDEWARRLRTNRSKARALVMAACRELFEESGTLLASYEDGRLITDATPFHPQRLALESHRLSFSQVLERNELMVRTDLLRPCSRWVSPQTDTHQFDMFSFVAVPPFGQEPDGQTREAASTGWFSPSLILDGWRAGLLQLVIPTWAHMLLLSEHDSVSSLMKTIENPTMEPIIGDPVDDPRYAEFFSFTPPRRF